MTTKFERLEQEEADILRQLEKLREQLDFLRLRHTIVLGGMRWTVSENGARLGSPALTSVEMNRLVAWWLNGQSEVEE